MTLSARGNGASSSIAQGRLALPVVFLLLERLITHGRVKAAAGVAEKSALRPLAVLLPPSDIIFFCKSASTPVAVLLLSRWCCWVTSL